MTSQLLIPLQQIRRKNLSLVGGKSAQLGEMLHAGFLVPDGFCLTTEAYLAFLRHNRLEKKIAERLKKITLENVEALSTELREIITAGQYPSTLSNEITKAWQKLGTDHAYAVRSSALQEDSVETSFAGQHDSTLNVIGEPEIVEKIRSCWTSLFNERALTYRLQHGLGFDSMQIGVLVQRLLPSEVSGILFTADPVTHHRKVIAIESSFGLGEALVSGLVTADAFKVEKARWTLFHKMISTKKCGIFPTPQGTTQKKTLPLSQQAHPSLSDEQVIRLAQLGQQLEDYYKQPQDVEWALVQNQFYITQTRPITTLYPIPPELLNAPSLRMLVCFNYLQSMSDPIRPLGQSVLSFVSGQLFSLKNPYHNPYLFSAGGRLFIDFSNVLSTRLGRFFVPKILSGAIDPELGPLLYNATKKAEFKSTIPFFRAWKLLIRFSFKVLFPVLIKEFLNIFVRQPSMVKNQTLSTAKRKIETLHQAFQALHSEKNSSKKLRRGEQILVKSVSLVFYVMPVLGAGFLSYSILNSLLKKSKRKNALHDIVRGLEGNITTEMDLAVGDLADVLLLHPALKTLLQDSPEVSLQAIREVEGGNLFLHSLKVFLKQYGHRGPGEIDITRDRMKDNATLILKIIGGNLTDKRPGDHRRHQEQLRQKAEHLQVKLISDFNHGFAAPLKRWFVQRLIVASRTYLSIREHPKSFIISLFDDFRTMLLEIAEQWVQLKRLDEIEDIYYLRLDEIHQMLSSPRKSFRKLILTRRNEWITYGKLSCPMLMTSDGELLRPERDADSFPKDAIPGTKTSAGIVEGIAHVILDPHTETLQKGEILIAPFTDPGWTPLFINAAGVVVEVGGFMTHGSVIAREYGIPAVVGVENATKRIQTGQRIRLNGDEGFIEIL